MERLVITGIGAITPIGIGAESYLHNLIDGACGVDRITQFDPSDLAVQYAAEVKGFRPTEHLPRHLIRETDSFMQYAYAAAQEALEDSGLSPDSNRTGIVMGTAMNGIATIASTQDTLSSAAHKKVGPRFIPKILGNVAAAQIAIAYGIRGPSYTLNTACASGGDAVSMAAMVLQSGRADAMVVVGSESALCPLVVYSLSNAQALSRQNAPNASRPFDAGRSGFVIGEGGGALILETEAHAIRRDARIYAELLGCGNNNDAYHVTAPTPDGGGAAACMELALADAGLSPGEIDYISAHGTATLLGDAAEVSAMKAVFGSALPAVSSIKGATGHMMGASGVLELVACIHTINTGMIPPTLHYETPDPACDIDCTPNHAVRRSVNRAMSNSFGFGGQNSSIILGKYF